MWIRLVLLALCVAEAALAKDTRPNIIVLMADDLGYGDLGCFGSPAVQTPNLDRMAAEGLKATRYYTGSAVCSPTRASMLTGRYPLRFDVTQHFNDVDRWLPVEAVTVAELLRDAGYATAHVGKWHLGGLHVDESGQRLKDQPGPREQGFEFYQTQIEQQPIRGKMGSEKTLFRQGGTVLLRNDQRVPESDPYFTKHFTDANGDFALEMIERLSKDERPFFLNVWWLVPHKPYEPAPGPHWEATAAPDISEDQHRFRSMVRHMDARIGDLMRRLEQLGIADNTLVIFTSDNGAAFEGYIGELKGGKTDLHEGGIRVPLLAWWPGHIKAGQTSEAFLHSNDWLPTFCEAAGVEVPAAAQVDGRSVLAHLLGGEAPTWEQRSDVHWQLNLYKSIQRHYPKPKPYATEVTRRDQWKLLTLDGEPVELFDVYADPYETRNLLAEHAELAASMREGLQQWLAEPRLRGGE